jgi:hypothetical protein
VSELWLPFEFSGVLAVEDVPGTYQRCLTIGSSVEIVSQFELVAEVIGLPLSSIPSLDDGEHVLNEWRNEIVGSRKKADPLWRRDCDAAFFTALFWSAAKFSIDHRVAVGYV